MLKVSLSELLEAFLFWHLTFVCLEFANATEFNFILLLESGLGIAFLNEIKDD